MKAHELARKLLEMPDLEIFMPTTGRSGDKVGKVIILEKVSKKGIQNIIVLREKSFRLGKYH